MIAQTPRKLTTVITNHHCLSTTGS